VSARQEEALYTWH